MFARVLGLFVLILSVSACSGSSQDSGGEGAQGGAGGTENKAQAEEFDRAAIGTWMAETCSVEQGDSELELVTIEGKGKGTIDANVYRGNTGCQGTPVFKKGNAFTYNVKRFVSGSGEITIGGSSFDITIERRTMVIQFNGNKGVYVKLK